MYERQRELQKRRPNGVRTFLQEFRNWFVLAFVGYFALLSCRVVRYPVQCYEIDPDSGSVIDSCTIIVSTRPPVYVTSFKIFPRTLHVKYPKDKCQLDSSVSTPAYLR